MKLNLLAAALSFAATAIASAAPAQVTINSSTSTPVATATVDGGKPADIIITSSGSIGVKAPGTAVTINSNNSVTNAGQIGFTNIDNAIGVLMEGGSTGNFIGTGTITVTESYTASTNNNNGLLTGAWAQGSDRTAIQVGLPGGSGTVTGGITQTGVITVQGNDSQGILVQAPLTGNLLMVTVTPATSSAAAVVNNGSININGDDTVGFQVAPGGAIGGKVWISSITARGVGAEAINIGGDIGDATGGALDISGSVSATAYRTTTRSTNTAVTNTYTASQMEQGGPAATIGANIAGGIIISAPPILTSTTNLDQDENGVPDAQQGTGEISVFGSAPALQIGATAPAGGGTAPAITIGPYTAGAGTAAVLNGYGLAIQGDIFANGVFDQFTSPYLPAPVSATALQIGGQITNADGTTSTSGSVTIAGGIYNEGQVTATAYQANATAIHIGAGATVPLITNTGGINANSTQVSNATTATPASGSLPAIPAPVAVNVTAIQIDKGATIHEIDNSSGIVAELTGTGGVGGNVAAIVDKSGTLSTINNTGSIVAELTQTYTAQLMPGTTVAIDMSKGTGPQSITQAVSQNSINSTPYVTTSSYTLGTIVSYEGNIYIATAAAGAGYDPVNYPTYWRQIGAQTPSISGDILMGSGSDTLDIEGGTVVSHLITMGAGLNTITVNNGASVSGAITEQKGGSFQINVTDGTLSDTSPLKVAATSVNVGATGVLIVAADPQNKTNTDFVVSSGASVFAPGAQIGLTMLSLQNAPVETYHIVETEPGTGATLTAGAFGTSIVPISPYLYTATPSYVQSADPATDPSYINLTVSLKSTQQLGFNAAQAAAFNSVLQALPYNTRIEQDVLSQTTQAGFQQAYNQLLPDQGQGIFEALDSAAQSVSAMTAANPDPSTRVAGSSLWLQEVNDRVDRQGVTTLGTNAKLLELVGGYEHMGLAGGALGATLAYINDSEDDNNPNIGAGVVASMVEAGLYYRRVAGPLTFSARAAGGYAWFSGVRTYVAPDVDVTANSSWDGTFVDGHAGVAYQQTLGRFYAVPSLSIDYLQLDESRRSEYGGGAGFDLITQPRDSSRLSGEALVTFGEQWGHNVWVRAEVRAGYRDIFSGNIGDTTASFAGVTGAMPFTMAPDPQNGGWATFGFSLKTGTQYSYVALEGDIDLREGEQNYDVRVAGRSMF
jgi:hypothetical protein